MMGIIYSKSIKIVAGLFSVHLQMTISQCNCAMVIRTSGLMGEINNSRPISASTDKVVYRLGYN